LYAAGKADGCESGVTPSHVSIDFTIRDICRNFPLTRFARLRLFTPPCSWLQQSWSTTCQRTVLSSDGRLRCRPVPSACSWACSLLTFRRARCSEQRPVHPDQQQLSRRWSTAAESGTLSISLLRSSSRPTAATGAAPSTPPRTLSGAGPCSLVVGVA